MDVDWGAGVVPDELAAKAALADPTASVPVTTAATRSLRGVMTTGSPPPVREV
jgi:hypothetical protein